MIRSSFAFFGLFVGLYLLTQLISVVDRQWDLTQDKRYTLSQATHTTLEKIDQPITIDVLLAGDLPPNYQRLRDELSLLLNEMTRVNDWIQYNFIDPFEGDQDREQLLQELYSFGLTPEVEIDEASQSTAQTIVVPWLIINRPNNQKSTRVSLLQKNLGDAPEERIEQSIQQLEYHLVDGFHRLLLTEKKRIAVIRSHNTSSDQAMMSLLQDLRPYYNLASFDLKAFPTAPAKTMENLLRFDMVLLSNPKAAFTTAEKFMLDQFMQAGKSSLLLIDPVRVAQDSLFNLQGSAVAYPGNLALDELLFAYGVRLNKDIVTDLYAAPIVLAQGEYSNSQYQPYPWVYHPLASPNTTHPIGNAVGNVVHQFVSSIDTLKSSLKKTVIVQTSERSKLRTPPFLIHLEEATKPLKPSLFTDPSRITGLLIEGKFPSLFTHRIHPFAWEKIPETQAAKMAIFADGNMAENQTDKGKPLELGYDKWTNNLYGNKPLLLNTIHYLMNQNDRLLLRSKRVRLAFLDRIKVADARTNTLGLAFGLPLLFLLVVALLMMRWRRSQYGQ